MVQARRWEPSNPGRVGHLPLPHGGLCSGGDMTLDDMGPGFRRCHLRSLGNGLFVSTWGYGAAKQPAAIYREPVASKRCHPVLRQGDSCLAMARSRAWPPQLCMLLARAGGCDVKAEVVSLRVPASRGPGCWPSRGRWLKWQVTWCPRACGRGWGSE